MNGQNLGYDIHLVPQPKTDAVNPLFPPYPLNKLVPSISTHQIGDPRSPSLLSTYSSLPQNLINHHDLFHLESSLTINKSQLHRHSILVVVKLSTWLSQWEKHLMQVRKLNWILVISYHLRVIESIKTIPSCRPKIKV